jgi:hypothetical protein
MADTHQERIEARRRQDTSNPLDKARSHRLLAVVKREVEMTPTKEPSTIVHVWPHLLMLEFLCAIVFTITLFLISALINAPLEGLADAQQTPNPSKAPWYFLNLQELLLHMDAALAGVIVPGVALLLIALIPYFDLGPGQIGRWFTSERGKAVTIFSAVFSVLVTVFLIALDVTFSVKSQVKNAFGGFFSSIKVPIPGGDNSQPFALADTPLDIVLSNWIIPLVCMFGFSALLVFLVKKRFGADFRDVCIALFTGFVVVFAVTTICSTAFRGEGQNLDWIWWYRELDRAQHGG